MGETLMRQALWQVVGEAFDTGLIVGLTTYEASHNLHGALVVGALAVFKALHALFTPPPGSNT
jgi:hypothetical protein